MINKNTVLDRNQRRGTASCRGIVKLLSAGAGMLTVLTAGCAHERPPRRIVDSHQVALPACPTPVPSLPDQAARQGVSGVVLVGYSVDPTGRVENIELEDPHASPILFEAVRGWLQQCRAPEPSPSRRIVELFSFPPPQTATSRDESPVAVADLPAQATKPVRSDKCSPDRPPPLIAAKGKMTVEYVVHSNGRVDEVARLGGDAPPVLLRGVRIWLQSCDYAPATRNGQPLAVKVVEEFNFTGE